MRCCGQDCPRAGNGRNDGARVSTRSNARKPKGAQQRPPRPRDAVCFALPLCSCVRCCGQDCPRAGNGRNNGARVSTRSNARKPKGAQQRPPRRGDASCCSAAVVCRACVAADKTVRAPGMAAMTERGFQPAATPENPKAPKTPTASAETRVCFAAAVCRACVAADKTVRAPGMAAITERGFQPAATPENPKAPNNAHHAPRDAVLFCGRLVSCVRCCGQDCPRAGNGRNDGARVSTRSNARKPKGAQQRPPRSARARVFCGAVCRACVAADKTVRAPGMAAMTERGFQPAATPENPAAPNRPLRRERVCFCGCRCEGALLRTRLSARREWPE